ncbi:MAG TPA: tripartite tricarboxylate transporter substrate-binding protein [Casimicrobiaceae bacterium]|nr:tripartite tricarboxylate transporter substrate-binding protein [Casimicrobiaceae bacterium]
MRAIVLIAGLAIVDVASAQDRTIRLVVGFPAGATADALTRLIAERMRERLGQPVIVENRPGAGGRLAVEHVKGLPADGTAFLLTPFANVVAHPHVYPKLRYDAFKDIDPVAHVANFQLALVVNASVPAKSLKDYVALVRSDPKYGNYASAAAGSLPHFFGVMFARAAGIELTHVPYKGTAPALTDLAGGQISAFSGVESDVLPLARADKARVLATSGAARSRTFPDVPTFREQGFDIEGSAWYAVYAPAGTPKAILDRVGAAVVDAVRSAEVKPKMEALGVDPTGLPAADLARIHKADYERWGPVIRASGFKPEE